MGRRSNDYVWTVLADTAGILPKRTDDMATRRLDKGVSGCGSNYLAGGEVDSATEEVVERTVEGEVERVVETGVEVVVGEVEEDITADRSFS